MADGRMLMIEWAHGWSVSRGARMPVAVDGGVRVDVNRPAASSRYVLAAFDSTSVSRLGKALVLAGTEIKTLAPAGALRACLDDAWTMYHRNELMITSFAHRSAAVPGGYSARVADVGAVVVAEIRDGRGEVVSSGRLARWGRYGIVDDVRTVTPHRRRGLATAVMTILGNRAVTAGLPTGLLSATDEGAALYRLLGWTGMGEIAGAVRSH